jgi:hypothetical protein
MVSTFLAAFRVSRWVDATQLLMFFCPLGQGQTYLNATGLPTFGTLTPIDNSFLKVANENPHLEFERGTFPQRSKKPLHGHGAESTIAVQRQKGWQASYHQKNQHDLLRSIWNLPGWCLNKHSEGLSDAYHATRLQRLSRS